MAKYIIKRILLMIPVLLGITFVVFGIMELSPGDPARSLLGEGARQEDVDALREEMGLNRPFMTRYVSYIGDAVQGDLGESYRTKLPVIEDIVRKFPNTFIIAFFGLMLALLIGVPLGIYSAVKQYSVIDIGSQIMAMFLSAMPAFFVGMLLLLAFSLNLKWFPATMQGGVSSYVLPSIAVTAATLAGYVRMTRSTMLEVIRQDYVRTAKAKGAGQGRIIFRHCLRNSLLPIVTQVGMSFAALMGGAVVVESVFSISGIGTYVLAGVRGKDVPVVMGVVIVISLFSCVVNLLVDIVYAFIDPRIKTQYLKG